MAQEARAARAMLAHIAVHRGRHSAQRHRRHPGRAAVVGQVHLVNFEALGQGASDGPEVGTHAEKTVQKHQRRPAAAHAGVERGHVWRSRTRCITTRFTSTQFTARSFTALPVRNLPVRNLPVHSPPVHNLLVRN